MVLGELTVVDWWEGASDSGKKKWDEVSKL